MSGYRIKNNPNRYLQERDGVFQYVRRVPTTVAPTDGRAPIVRISLKTSNIAEAMIKRDHYERADDDLWRAMKAGGGSIDAHRDKYRSAVARAEAVGISYSPAVYIADTPLDQFTARFVDRSASGIEDAKTILGAIDRPPVTVSEALKIYFNEITPHEVSSKSPNQKKRWVAHKQRAIDSFIEVLSDKALDQITREDAQVFYRHWLQKVAPKKGMPTHSASAGNRAIGGMRVLFSDYYKHMGDADKQNPFRDLGFSDKIKRTRPPFSSAWIQNKILAVGALDSLNHEARGIVLAMIETGCRPSELCNITPQHIMLSHRVPHIVIQPRHDPKDPREIKTGSSVRTIPLVGIAHDVFKKHRAGFPRYKDKEDLLSATLNKFFKNNELFPTDDHTIYSLRHAFEDRMKEAGLDDELRRLLMGHTVDRPRYGTGGSLEWRKEQMEKFTLPYNASIV
ncbi:tyrosine-type recombinase/integrase [Brucella sp. HL-2]|nr:tyrosine-type recombinase/integrase [Brucella sp. HL-2]MCV9907069.1 tyrosine-type recombinase/integrase [Brucella sp. HL-2]